MSNSLTIKIDYWHPMMKESQFQAFSIFHPLLMSPVSTLLLLVLKKFHFLRMSLAIILPSRIE